MLHCAPSARLFESKLAVLLENKALARALQNSRQADFTAQESPINSGIHHELVQIKSAGFFQ